MVHWEAGTEEVSSLKAISHNGGAHHIGMGGKSLNVTPIHIAWRRRKFSVEIRTFSTFEDHNHDTTQIKR